MPSSPRSLKTKIEAGVLLVRFDAGHWIELAHGASEVLSVNDLDGSPRAGRVSYRNEWGLTMVASFFLRAPRRLG